MHFDLLLCILISKPVRDPRIVLSRCPPDLIQADFVTILNQFIFLLQSEKKGLF